MLGTAGLPRSGLVPFGSLEEHGTGEALKPGAKDTGSVHILGDGGVGTVWSPLCLEQSPNLFSSVTNTQIAPKETCSACLWLC